MKTERWCFVCHLETLVKTIGCNLTKTCRMFKTFTESLYIYIYGDASLKFSRSFTDLSQNYTLVYITGTFVYSKH